METLKNWVGIMAAFLAGAVISTSFSLTASALHADVEAGVGMSLSSPAGYPDSSIGIRFTSQTDGSERTHEWQLDGGTWQPVGTPSLIADDVYDVAVIWPEGSKAEGTYVLQHSNGIAVDGFAVYPLADGLTLDCEFVLAGAGNVGGDPSSASAGDAPYTQQGMKDKFQEFKENVAAGWEEWQIPPWEFAMPIPPSYLNAESDNGGVKRNLTVLTLEEIQAFSDMDIFLLECFYDNMGLVLPDTPEYHDPEAYLAWVNEWFVDLCLVDELSALVLDYAEYASAFWEATGLVYSPYEDIFYVQSGIPIPYVEGQTEIPAAEALPVEEEIDIYDGLSEDDQRELKAFIEEATEELGESPEPASEDNGLPGVLTGVVAGLVLLAVVVAVILIKKNRKFMSDPKSK